MLFVVNFTGFAAAVEKIKENDHVGDKILPDHKSREEIIKEEQHSENGSHTKKPQLRKLNNISTTTTEAKLPLPEQSSSMVQKANTQKEPVHFEPIKINRLNNLFTSKELNSCIVASGNIRIFCAFIIAILVVISYVDYPLFGINLVRSQSVVASRPLYLLLLTDVTIVAAHLLYLKKLSGFEQSEEEKQVPQADEEADNWEGAFKVLERGLVVYQAIRGIFMDCSVYTVVVVCGLSLV
ncbi:hypothetical protein FEM48_Zijuj01G0295000 [Ziziphus jujuba var. spinosa]|uniref:Uncharacterized protein n=1 Tax=Ziziphus jujuba var. spinosa TaxID=714518 RepID=A0A978W5R5_ZIZJJ|nr:hypothetical protein FEM48_Zijuj01G0295000 [Ziziphus jujuba var. spinosa]